MFEIAMLVAGAYVAAVISGAAGFGGALLLLPLLTRVVGVTNAVPLLTVAQLVGNASRIAFGWREICWRPVLLFLLSALPGCVIGALFFASLPKAAVVRVVGAAMVLFVILRTFSLLRLPQGRLLLLGGGALVGLLSGLVGSAGPLGAAIFLSLNLPPVAYIASEATTAVAMHLVKSAVYQATLPLDRAFWPLALCLGAAMIAGVWTARQLVESLPRQQFRQGVAILLVVVGLQMAVFG